MTTSESLVRLVISPSVWPGKDLPIQPGDLSQFAPYGNGVYGYQPNSVRPIINGPEQEPSGGFIYFDNSVSKTDFQGFLRMIGVNTNYKDYAAFIKESTTPGKDQYLTQMRLVSKLGLSHLFKAISDKEYDSFKEQDLTIEEALWEFIAAEKREYGTFFGNGNLEGKFGGDGDFAQEQLNFGFAMENEYLSIYRIWSRAWLVTK